MKPRDIVLANLEHKPSPRPAFNFTTSNRINDFIGCGIQPPLTTKRWVEGRVEFYTDVYGNVWHRMVDGCVKGEIYKHVLQTWDDLNKVSLPDYSNKELYVDMKELFSKPSDKLKVAYIGGWVFDNARYMRRLDNYLMDMILERDKVIALNNMVAKIYKDKIIMSAESGAEAISIGEDLGTQTGPLFGPIEYEEILFPTYKQLVDLAHSYGMKVLLHSCGQNSILLDLMIKVGFDAFQFDQPAIYDYQILSKKLKQHKRALYSPIDIQKVLPTGDRDYIEYETQRLFENFNGFLILKNYPDLKGIGVKEEWDNWAYEKLLQLSNIN